MRQKVFYCAFYGATSGGVSGQQNLSRPVRTLLAEAYEVVDLSPAPETVDFFPRLGAVISAMHRLLLARLLGRRAQTVTVVDMVHSFTVLPSSRARDRLIVLGHDSYALRTRRDLAAARGLVPRLRLSISSLGWSYVEFLQRRLAWRSFFVSPIDRALAARGRPSDLLAIPVPGDLLAAGNRRRALPQRKSDGPLRILVSLPVMNPTQNRIDRDLVARLLQVIEERNYEGRVEITLWGKGARPLAGTLSPSANVRVVDWVEDYAEFLAGFDLLVYPRLIGSGFHTKLAEALVLGVPCICADWAGQPLRAAGYDGFSTFSSLGDFKAVLARILDGLASPEGLPLPTIPFNAAPKGALAPLLVACSEALPSL